jgi:hypothetical protein
MLKRKMKKIIFKFRKKISCTNVPKNDMKSYLILCEWFNVKPNYRNSQYQRLKKRLKNEQHNKIKSW